MAATKLRASAPPYHSTGLGRRTACPVHVTAYGNYQGAPAFPTVVVVASRFCVPLFVPAPHLTCGSLPMAPVPCKAPLVPPCCNAATLPPLALPLPPSPPPPLTAPVHVTCVASPFLPHKMVQSQAQATSEVQAAMSAVQAGEEPSPTVGSHARGRDVPPRMLRGRRRQARPVSAPARSPSPSPVFTTRPPSTSPPPPVPEWFAQPVTTVMIRNIPVKLTPGEMTRLLDDHCARANRSRRRGVRSAYDFLYLRMDFSMRRNMGYAFVNLTTAEAARRLYRDLHGSRWKVFASKKVVVVCPASIQGKDAQVRHLRAATYACDTDEFLPAVFSPPRDGSGDGADPCSPAGINRLGHRVPRPPLAGANRLGLSAPRPPLAGTNRRLGHRAPRPPLAGRRRSGRLCMPRSQGGRAVRQEDRSNDASCH